MRYGFIGLGNLGAPLASSLRRAGFDLTVNDIDPAAAGPLLAAGRGLGRQPARARRASRCGLHLPPLPGDFRAGADRARTGCSRA